MNQTLIANQTVEAKQQFPNLACNTAFNFSIQIQGYNFEIALTNEYPNAAPIVKLQGQQFLIPLVKYWQPVYTLLDVLMQLNAYAQTPRPTEIYDNFQEIQMQLHRFPQEKLSSEEGRKEILFSNSNYAKAVQEKQTSDRLIQEERQKINELVQQITNISNELSKKIREQQMMSQQYMQNNQMISQQMNQSKQIKIAELKNQISKLENDIQEIRMKLSRKTITIDEFLSEYNKIKQNQIYNKKLIKLIQQTIF